MTKRCNRCICDETIPGILFDENGICSCCHEYDKFDKQYPISDYALNELWKKIHGAGRNKKYNCIVGVSGGCDSSYLLYEVVRQGLRPLAVHYDNGWNLEIAVSNMKTLSAYLNVPLEIYTPNPAECNDIWRSFIKALVPDLEASTDIAFTTTLYKAAEAHKVKYILIGHSFRTEGIAPIKMAYMDGRYIADVHKRFGRQPLGTFPNLWMLRWLYWLLIGIKRARPLYYLDYNKDRAKELLSTIGWKWYGGHHKENLFTEFFIDYFRYTLCGIDSRLIELSALIRSGQMSREEALGMIEKPVQVRADLVKTVMDRLSLTPEDLKPPENTYRDYRTYKQVFEKLRWLFWLAYKMDYVPRTFYKKYCRR